MSKGCKRRPEDNKSFMKNFDAIFGTSTPKRGSYVQDPQTGKLVPKSEYQPPESSQTSNVVVHGDITSFVSPIDGSIIDDRAKLREHNRRHGVTNVQDYGADWFKRRGREKSAELMGKTKQAKQARIDEIKRALHQHGIDV